MNKHLLLFLSLSLMRVGSIVCAEKDVIDKACNLIKNYKMYPPYYAYQCADVSNVFKLLFKDAEATSLDEQGSVLLSRPIVLAARLRTVEEEGEWAATDAFHAIVAKGESGDVEEVHLLASGKKSNVNNVKAMVIFGTTYAIWLKWAEQSDAQYKEKHQMIVATGIKELKNRYPELDIVLGAGRVETNEFFKKAGVDIRHVSCAKSFSPMELREALANPTVIQSALSQ